MRTALQAILPQPPFPRTHRPGKQWGPAWGNTLTERLPAVVAVLNQGPPDTLHEACPMLWSAIRLGLPQAVEALLDAGVPGALPYEEWVKRDNEELDFDLVMSTTALVYALGLWVEEAVYTDDPDKRAPFEAVLKVLVAHPSCNPCAWDTGVSATAIAHLGHLYEAQAGNLTQSDRQPAMDASFSARLFDLLKRVPTDQPIEAVVATHDAVYRRRVIEPALVLLRGHRADLLAQALPPPPLRPRSRL